MGGLSGTSWALVMSSNNDQSTLLYLLYFKISNRKATVPRAGGRYKSLTEKSNSLITSLSDHLS